MQQWWEDLPALDTLRLSPREYGAIFAQLGRRTDQQRGVINSRKHKRVPYRRESVKVVFYREATTNVPYLVKSHNLSASGIAFVHGFFVQTGTRCDLALRRATAEAGVVAGKVVRCRFLSGRVHEIAIEFDQPVDLRPYLGAHATSAQCGTTMERPTQFAGRMLYVDDSPDDRALVESLASQMGVETRVTARFTDALLWIGRESFDLLMARIHILSDGGFVTIRSLQRQGYSGPIVAVSKGGSGSGEASAMAAGCDCVLGMPITRDRLADLFVGYLAPRAEGEVTQKS